MVKSIRRIGVNVGQGQSDPLLSLTYYGYYMREKMHLPLNDKVKQASYTPFPPSIQFGKTILLP